MKTLSASAVRAAFCGQTTLEEVASCI